MPLSVNCTKLMYVAMIFLLQFNDWVFWGDEIKHTLRLAIRGPNVDRNTRRLCATCNRNSASTQTLGEVGPLHPRPSSASRREQKTPFSLQPSLRSSRDASLWSYPAR